MANWLIILGSIVIFSLGTLTCVMTMIYAFDPEMFNKHSIIDGVGWLGITPVVATIFSTIIFHRQLAAKEDAQSLYTF